MLPASIDSLMPGAAPDAPSGAGSGSALSKQRPADGAESALNAFAALLQAGLGELEGEATPAGLPEAAGDSTGLPETLSGLLDTVGDLPPDGKNLPVIPVIPQPMAFGGEPRPRPGNGQEPTLLGTRDASSPMLDELAAELTLDQKPTVPRDMARIQAEFARLVAAARLNTAEPRLPDAEPAPTSLTSMQALSGEARTSDPSSTARPLAMNTPLQHPDWNNEFAQRITWMANHKIQAAELRLNPQHLGPIDIQVRMDGDQANLVFGAAHAQVRDAIEAALPRLREMFAAQGLNVAQVNVDVRDGNAQQFAGGQAGTQGGGSGAAHEGASGGADMTPGDGVSGTVIQVASGLVDIFA